MQDPTLRSASQPISESAASKIVISGTGRAGTTLLVRLLGALGLDTGERSDVLVGIDKRSHGGLECLFEDRNAPTGVNDLTLPSRLDGLFRANVVSIQHVIVPVRSLDLAAARPI